MATIRVSNIEAKADAGSPTIDERVTFKRSTGENGVVIDSKQVGITSVGINTDNPQAELEVVSDSITTSKITSLGDDSETRTTRLDFNFSDGGGAGIAAKRAAGVANTETYLSIRTGGSTNDDEKIRITSGGDVGIGTDNPTEKLTVNGHISSDPIFITTYGAGEDLDISTEQTVDLDLTLSTSGTSDFTVSATGVITVLKAGTYQISYSISTAVTLGSARSTSRAYLRLNGSGEITATRTYMYNREVGNGVNTASKTIMLALTANDTLELRALRNSGSDTIVVIEDHTTISLVRLT